MWNKSLHHDLSSRISINWTLKKNCITLKFMIPYPGLILICHSFKLINEEEVIKATDSCSFISAASFWDLLQQHRKPSELLIRGFLPVDNYHHRHTVVSVFSDGHWWSSAPVLWVRGPAFTSGNRGGKQTVRIRPSVEYIYRQIDLNWFTDNLWALTDPGFKACDEASLLPVWRNTHIGWSGCVLLCSTRWGWRGSPPPPQISVPPYI